MPSTEIAGLRFLHWNVHSWQSPGRGSITEKVKEVIEESRADIVSLVEVDEQWGNSAKLAGVSESLGYAWIFVPSFEFGNRSPLGGFGNALLVKPRILAIQQWHLLWPTRVYDGTEESEQRAMVLAKIEHQNEAWWVGSTHLARRSKEARQGAIEQVMKLCANLLEPWAICGDFNLSATDWIAEGQGFTFSPNPPVATYPTDQPSEAIDYCIFSSDLTFRTEVLTVTYSDHLPILTEGSRRTE